MHHGAYRLVLEPALEGGVLLSDVSVATGLAAHRAQLFLEPVTRLPCARNGSDHYSWVAGRKVSVPHLLGCAELHGRGGKLC